MGILSDPSLIAAAEFDFPSGTVRWSKPGFGSDSGGMYEERIISSGSVPLSRGDERYALETPEITLIIDDSDKSFSNRLGAQEPILNANARLYVASKNYSFSSWHQAFIGRLSFWQRSARTQVSLTVKPPDFELDAAFPVLTIDADWPDADPAVRGARIPILYGRHDSAGATNKGAVPCLYVKSDANPFRYAPTFGWAKVIRRVYKDNVRLATSAYTISHPVLNGRQWTTVDFSTSQGSSTISVDADGIESIGDGTGALLSKPGEVMKHVLSNFTYAHASRLWLPTTTRINAASFDGVDSFLAKRANGASYRAARHIQGETTARTLLNDWCLSNVVYAWWDAGLLYVGADDPHTSAIYIDDPWMQYPEDELGPDGPDGLPDSFRDGADEADRSNRVMVTVGPLAGGGDDILALEVFDPLGKVEATDDIAMSWGPAVLQS